MSNHTIFKDTIRITVDESIIDYEVKYDVTGKVYDIKPLVFDLPEIAQKLALGDISEAKKQKIYDYESLIKIILPFGIVGKTSVYEEALSSVVSSINTEIKKKGIVREELYKIANKDSYEYSVLAAYLNPGMNPENFNSNLEQVLNFIEKIDNRYRKSNFLSIISNHPKAGFNLLALIIPFLEHGEKKRQAYINMSNYKDEECKSFLLKAFQVCKDGYAIGGIIKAISLQEIQYPSLQNDLIKSYNSEIEFSLNSTKDLIDVLQTYPNKKTRSFLMRVIDLNGDASLTAARALMKIGFAAYEISEILLPKLSAAHPVDSINAFRIFSSCDELTRFLPSSNELIEASVETFKGHRNIEMAYTLPILIKKKYDSSIPAKLLGYLDSTNVYVIGSILMTINAILSNTKMNHSPFATENAITKYEKVLNCNDEDVIEDVLKIIEKIRYKENQVSLIPMLLQHINFDDEENMNLFLIRAINKLLPYSDYINELTGIYLTIVKYRNPAYRLEGLKGLKYSNEVKLLDSLTYLKDDPSVDVQNAFKELSSRLNRIKEFNKKKASLFEVIPENSIEWSKFNMLSESEQNSWLRLILNVAKEDSELFFDFIHTLDSKGIMFKMVYYKAICLNLSGWGELLNRELSWLKEQADPKIQRVIKEDSKTNDKLIEDKTGKIFTEEPGNYSSGDLNLLDSNEQVLIMEAITILTKAKPMPITVKDLMDLFGSKK